MSKYRTKFLILVSKLEVSIKSFEKVHERKVEGKMNNHTNGQQTNGQQTYSPHKQSTEIELPYILGIIMSKSYNPTVTNKVENKIGNKIGNIPHNRGGCIVSKVSAK